MNKKTVLKRAIAGLKKKQPNLKLGFAELDELQFIPTPFNTLNALCNHSRGSGIPRGKFGVIAGAQQTAKTTLLQQVIAFNMQLDPDFIALWTDAENALDEDWCKTLGIDLDRLIIHRAAPDNPYMERILEDGLTLVKSQAVDMWVIDSIGALMPQSENTKELEEGKMLDHPRKMGEFFRKANNAICPTGDEFQGTACVLIGQVYNAPTTSGVGLEEVRGGNAVKHWAYWRWKTRRGRKDEGPGTHKFTMPDGETRDIIRGWPQHIKIDKTKVNDREGQEVVLQFMFGRGLDSIQAAISSLFGNDVMERKGGWYYHPDFPSGKLQGKPAVIQLLAEDIQLREQLISEMDLKLITPEINNKYEDKHNDSDSTIREAEGGEHPRDSEPGNL